MLGINNTAKALASQNKEALKVGASLEAGRIINHKVADLVKPKLPMMVRGYADSALGEAVIANIVAGAIINFMPQNEKAVKVAELMVMSAGVEFVESFNIEAMLDELLKDVNLPDLPVLKTEDVSNGK